MTEAQVRQRRSDHGGGAQQVYSDDAFPVLRRDLVEPTAGINAGGGEDTVQLSARGLHGSVNRRRGCSGVVELNVFIRDRLRRLNPIKHQRCSACRLYGRRRRGTQPGRTAGDQDRPERLRRDVADAGDGGHGGGSHETS